MQGPTHILAGVIIRHIFDWKRFRAFGIVLTVIFALLVHGIFDQLAMVTYQPALVDFTDPFWLVYHVAMWLSSLVLIYMYWDQYRLGIIVSLVPEIDWIVMYVSGLTHRVLLGYRVPLMHTALSYIVDSMLPWLRSLPDYREYPWACIFELLLCALLIAIFKAIVQRRRNIHF